MLLTEIATAQPHFLNDLGSLRVSYFQDRFSSVSVTFANEQKFFPAWKCAKQKYTNLNSGHVELQRGPLLVKGIATLDSNPLVKDEEAYVEENSNNAKLGISSKIQYHNHESSNEDFKELDEREKERRMRISKANKGNTPWNKGRKHSPETLQRIRERTRLAMQNPKVKKKLVESRQGRSYSEETRMKISLGVKIGWEKLRGKQMMQEACCSKWQNLIAVAARQGYSGEDELQWDSYELLDEKLKQEWVDRVEQRKMRIRAPGNRTAPKSAEQKRKISEAISARWADSGYRERVCSALAKYYAIRPRKERKPRRKSSEVALSTRRTSKKKNVSKEDVPKVQEKVPLRKRNSLVYKDPLVSSKLEMIKNIRAQRAAAKSKETEAIERARLLIAEAEKASKALEVAATQSPVAYASLIEARKLIAKAVRSIKAIEAQQVSDQTVPSALVSNEVAIDEDQRVAGSAFEVQQQSYQTEINGKPAFSYSIHESSNSHCIGVIPIAKLLQPKSSHGYSLSVSSVCKIQKSDLGPTSQLRQLEAELSTESSELQTSVNGTQIQSREEETKSKLPNVTKRWVRGRLVEVLVEA